MSRSRGKPRRVAPSWSKARTDKWILICLSRVDMIDYGHVFSVAESEKSDKLRTEKAERRKGTASGVRYYDATTPRGITEP